MSTTLTSVQPCWPRRLLHVDGDQLTSVERSGEATYGAFDAPPYNILSYTWGRFALREGDDGYGDVEPIRIHNVPWAIPRIRPEHFTAEKFLRVIRLVASGITGSSRTSHVWLDVACIHQEDRAEKMDEIGRQAAIFDRALDSFIWLSRLPAELLSRHCRNLHVTNGPLWIEDRHEDISSLLADPWFSSLWTLQESFLRSDAVWVAREGCTVPSERFPDSPLGQSDLVSYGASLRDALRTELARPTAAAEHRELGQAVFSMLDDLGVGALARSNAVQLYSVANRRCTLHPLDRIYGIMQVFGFVLGEARDPERTFSLGELEDELGIAMNKENAMFAQLFVHLQEPPPLRRWRIQPQISIPSRIHQLFDWGSRVSCAIGYDAAAGTAVFRGPAADFAALAAHWRDVSVHPRFQAVLSTPEVVLLDRTDRNAARLHPALGLDSRQGGPGELNDLLTAEYGAGLRVLVLGQTQDICRGRRGGWAWCGVLVHPETVEMSDGVERTAWLRLGVCVWEFVAEELDETMKALLRDDELYLG
ncbi:hypothetical protein RB601_009772 [Gaeumannomyces tritici]